MLTMSVLKKILDEWDRVPPYGKWILIIGWGFVITMLLFGGQIYSLLGI